MDNGSGALSVSQGAQEGMVAAGYYVRLSSPRGQHHQPPCSGHREQIPRVMHVPHESSAPGSSLGLGKGRCFVVNGGTGLCDSCFQISACCSFFLRGWGCSLPAEGMARKKPQGGGELAFSESSKEARVAQGSGRGEKDLWEALWGGVTQGSFLLGTLRAF